MRVAAIALSLTAVLGCSASTTTVYQPASASPPAEVQPTWTPVRLPSGNDGYVAEVCLPDGNWVILSFSFGYASLGATGIAYGGKC